MPILARDMDDHRRRRSLTVKDAANGWQHRNKMAAGDPDVLPDALVMAPWPGAMDADDERSSSANHRRLALGTEPQRANFDVR